VKRDRSAEKNPMAYMKTSGRFESLRVDLSKRLGITVKATQVIEYLMNFYDKHKTCGDTSRG